jgi:hypothetical protein
MSSHKAARVARVLSGALRVWGVSARVEKQPGAIMVGELRVVPDAPHGWMVFRDGRLLGVHAGLPGLLRTLRDEL